MSASSRVSWDFARGPKFWQDDTTILIASLRRYKRNYSTLSSSESAKMPATRRLAVDDLTPNHIGTFKKLHQVIFPQDFSPSFYKDALNSAVTLSKLAYFNDIPVGCFSVRITPEKNGARFYILTFGVLAPYRRCGLGAKMMQYIEDAVREAKGKDISLHVKQDNDDARAWYKKQGYTEETLEEHYYKAPVLPTGAYLLRKTIRCDGHSNASETKASAQTA
jgi:ribosomal protein S18 acetylase RimI-like enzyme